MVYSLLWVMQDSVGIRPLGVGASGFRALGACSLGLAGFRIQARVAGLGVVVEVAVAVVVEAVAVAVMVAVVVVGGGV